MCRARATEQVQQLSCSECGKEFNGITEIPVDLGNGGLLCLACDYNESLSDKVYTKRQTTINDKDYYEKIEGTFLDQSDGEGLKTWQHNENSY